MLVFAVHQITGGIVARRNRGMDVAKEYGKKTHILRLPPGSVVTFTNLSNIVRIAKHRWKRTTNLRL